MNTLTSIYTGHKRMATYSYKPTPIRNWFKTDQAMGIIAIACFLGMFAAAAIEPVSSMPGPSTPEVINNFKSGR